MKLNPFFAYPAITHEKRIYDIKVYCECTLAQYVMAGDTRARARIDLRRLIDIGAPVQQQPCDPHVVISR
jgi:hypothetical protein